MEISSVNAAGSPTADEYSQAIEVEGLSRLLFVSGQIGMDGKGAVPDEFEAQCRLAWKNVQAQLSEANMTVANIVKINTFLSDRKYAEMNGKVRAEVLEGNKPANSSMVATILDSAWLLEIEVVAAG